MQDPVEEPVSSSSIVDVVAYVVDRVTTAVSWESCEGDVLARVASALGASGVRLVQETDPALGRSELGALPWQWASVAPSAARAAHGSPPAAPGEGVEPGVRDDVVAFVGSSLRVPVMEGERVWGHLEIDRGDGSRRWGSADLQAVRTIAQIIGAAIRRLHLERQRNAAEAVLRSHIENIPAVTYIEYTDAAHPLGYDEAYVSPQIYTMFGYTQQEWVNDHDQALWARVIHPEDRSVVDELAAATSESGEPYAAEYRMRRADGSWAWVRDEAHLVQGDGDLPAYWHGVIVDITARKEAEEQVAFLAYHDHLTGLANRAMFEAMLEPALARARRHRLSLGVLFMDLDDFKAVNDAFGHQVGDTLLKEVADRLRSVTRETDLVARHGGDEFLVMIPDIEAEAAVGGDPVQRAEQIVDMMTARIHDAMSEPFRLGGQTVRITLSIGASVFPLDASDARSLLRNSDAAMYANKKDQRTQRQVH
ncbi:MAG TPA: diguanylate cyclase [Actinomycetota bacterium]